MFPRECFLSADLSIWAFACYAACCLRSSPSLTVLVASSFRTYSHKRVNHFDFQPTVLSGASAVLLRWSTLLFCNSSSSECQSRSFLHSDWKPRRIPLMKPRRIWFPQGVTTRQELWTHELSPCVVETLFNSVRRGFGCLISDNTLARLRGASERV